MTVRPGPGRTPVRDAELLLELPGHSVKGKPTSAMDDTPLEAWRGTGFLTSLPRLFVQIERILKVNGLSVMTHDVVEAARGTLVIGAI